MMLKSDKIAERIDQAVDPLYIIPKPEPAFKDSGDASLELRLGTWFLALRHSRTAYLEIPTKDSVASFDPERRMTRGSYAYVPFGKEYVLHPQTFVLGTTLEWLRFPVKLGGYVIGKSSLGRHGLIIATATGVHPGFIGCLTLELANVGAIPIALRPGMKICQLFFHEVISDTDTINKSSFSGKRKPTLSPIKLDDRAEKLAR